MYREEVGLGGALRRARIHPDNVWASRGLLDCLERRGEAVKAALDASGMEKAAMQQIQAAEKASILSDACLLHDF